MKDIYTLNINQELFLKIIKVHSSVLNNYSELDLDDIRNILESGVKISLKILKKFKGKELYDMMCNLSNTIDPYKIVSSGLHSSIASLFFNADATKEDRLHILSFGCNSIKKCKNFTLEEELYLASNDLIRFVSHTIKLRDETRVYAKLNNVDPPGWMVSW